MKDENFTKDNEGNIVGCPACGARSLKKDGFAYYANNKEKRQIWFCGSCSRKTVNPTIITLNPFSVEERDPDSVPITELIDFRKKQFKLKKQAKDQSKLINIKINIDGPIGIAHLEILILMMMELIYQKLFIIQILSIKLKECLLEI